jgi:monooxygenase
VTDRIASITEGGVQLESGGHLDADIIVTATGLDMRLMGGMEAVVDGEAVDLSRTMSYKGMMFSGVPNLAYAFGYTNASWTLKCDLTAAYVCRLLNHMDRHGLVECRPRPDPTVAELPALDFTSGYVRRALDRLPKQGATKPWRLNQNYILDLLDLRIGRIEDGTMEFRSAPTSGDRAEELAMGAAG